MDHDGVVHLTRGARAAASERPGIRTHRAHLEEHEVVVVRGLRMTGPVRVFVDLAGRLDTVTATILRGNT